MCIRDSYGSDHLLWFLVRFWSCCVVCVGNAGMYQAQVELLHEKAGHHTVMVRRSFPAFNSIGGLRTALSIKIKVRLTSDARFLC